MDAACITYEAISFEQDEFPRTKEPVWILGKQYITYKGKDNFRSSHDLQKTLKYLARTLQRKFYFQKYINYNFLIFCQCINAICYSVFFIFSSNFQYNLRRKGIGIEAFR